MPWVEAACRVSADGSHDCVVSSDWCFYWSSGDVCFGGRGFCHSKLWCHQFSVPAVILYSNKTCWHHHCVCDVTVLSVQFNQWKCQNKSQSRSCFYKHFHILCWNPLYILTAINKSHLWPKTFKNLVSVALKSQSEMIGRPTCAPACLRALCPCTHCT